MQIFPTRMCNVTAWRHSRLRAHLLMTLKAGGWEGIPRELQRLLSLIGYGSTGGVCGRSLTAGKILFSGRQTCSLYLILWLCGLSSSFRCGQQFQQSLIRTIFICPCHSVAGAGEQLTITANHHHEGAPLTVALIVKRHFGLMCCASLAGQPNS